MRQYGTQIRKISDVVMSGCSLVRQKRSEAGIFRCIRALSGKKVHVNGRIVGGLHIRGWKRNDAGVGFAVRAEVVMKGLPSLQVSTRFSPEFVRIEMSKRFFDVTASLCGLVVTAPLLVLLAIWVKFDSPGPVFYRALRAGRHGKPFRVFKFRSMMANADQIGGPTTSDGDSRVTRSGRFIRKFKLDELSQLINVLRGEMSLVGPRPEIVEKVAKFSDEEKQTLLLRPGITDWASIWNSDEGGVLEGAPDPDAVYEEVIRPTKMKLQLYYYHHRSFWNDLRIICYTLMRIVRKSWTPKELKEYPDFEELRAKALKVIERQKTEAAENNVSVA